MAPRSAKVKIKRAIRPRFYVYQLENAIGESAYIGKGSGRRLSVQQIRYKLVGHEIAWFWREQDAYEFEVQAIAERRPYLNRHKGGNGSRVTPKRFPYVKPQPWEIEMKRIGTRVYVARFLIRNCLHLMDPSKVESIRAVAYG